MSLDGNKLVPDPLGKPEAKPGVGTLATAAGAQRYFLSGEFYDFRGDEFSAPATATRIAAV